MELYISDLNISDAAKHTLHELGFTMTSELKNYDYISLIQKFPFKVYNIYSIIRELNNSGFLLPAKNEISIYDITMSKRLFHILERNHILYLSQLSLCSKEELSHMRNLGTLTMTELESICQSNHIELHSVQNIKDNLSPYHFPFSLEHYEKLYRYHISHINDFNNITTQDLHIICKYYYPYTMRSYYILKDNGITLQTWEDQYLFEILPRETARVLEKRYCIDTISKLRSYSERSINHMPSSILSIIRPILKE